MVDTDRARSARAITCTLAASWLLIVLGSDAPVTVASVTVAVSERSVPVTCDAAGTMSGAAVTCKVKDLQSPAARPEPLQLTPPVVAAQPAVLPVVENVIPGSSGMNAV